MIQLKDASVKMFGLSTEMLFGSQIVEGIYQELGYACVVTSGTELTTKHSKTSLHYSGNALDFRTRHVRRDELDVLLTAVDKSLVDDDVSNEYDAFVEDRDGPHEHLHVEFQPKGRR